MHGTYDRAADAAYIYLVDEISPGGSEASVEVEADEICDIVLVDLDEHGRLLGLEVLSASLQLRPETLASLRQIG